MKACHFHRGLQGILTAGSKNLQDSGGCWIISSGSELVDRKRKGGVLPSQKIKGKCGWCESFTPEGARARRKRHAKRDRRPREWYLLAGSL